MIDLNVIFEGIRGCPVVRSNIKKKWEGLTSGTQSKLGGLWAVWPDMAICHNFGNFSAPLEIFFIDKIAKHFGDFFGDF